MPHDDPSTAPAGPASAPGAEDSHAPAPVSASTAQDVPLDVRTLPHAQRHATIFGLLPRLAAGQALVISADHDPRPLRYQLEALSPNAYAWEYLEQGPDVWRVALRKSVDAG